MRIVCVGGGPAGLFFAILMKKLDRAHDVVVLERKPEGRAGGWGVVFWDDLLADLRDNDPETAARIRESAYNWNGQHLNLEDERAEHEGGGYGIARSKVLDILADRAQALGVDIRFDCDVSSASEFADADVVVACDGANSVLRQADEHFGTEVAVGRNKYVWLGTTKVFDAFTFAFVHTDAGWVWCHAYAFDDHTSTFIVECAPETWSQLGFDTRAADESLKILGEIFERQLDGEPLLGLGRDDTPLPWLNFRTLTNEHWYSGHTVLMGDAAHTTHFAIGSGMRLAFQDAIALAAEFQRASAPEAAFAEYERKRRAALIPPQNEARWSAHWFENVPRYADVPAPGFLVLLRARRDPMQTRIPPKLYYRLYKAADSVGFLRTLRHRLGPKARALYSRRRRVTRS
jgi:2-polyprenyl-6-methoxyphenol hydroxylase-like FAD-dependent oxidoreductase